jgi:hypothetical protein
MGSSEIGPGFLIYGGDMPEHHKVNVVRIDEILPHPNADTLGIVYIGGYQVVVKKDNYKVGDLAIYVPPDTIVPEHHAFAFLWEGTEPTERRRRVTVRRFRKEWSEGLLMPMSDFANPVTFAEGDDVAELLGFKHYEEPEPVQNINRTKVQYQSPFRSPMAFWYWLLYKLGIKRDQLHGSNAKPPKSAPPVYDVESFKNYPRLFSEGEEVIVTEKIHGSNARFMFDGKKMHVGSKNLWKSEKSTCIWRRALKELPWIEEFCREYPTFTLYAEVVPTQKGYTYGTPEGKVRVFGFDALRPDGTWVDKRDLYALDPLGLGQNLVPLLNGHCKQFDHDTIKALVEGPSTVPGSKHIREGIVITSAIERQVRGVGRAQLKLKSMAFLEKETK